GTVQTLSLQPNETVVSCRYRVEGGRMRSLQFDLLTLDYSGTNSPFPKNPRQWSVGGLSGGGYVGQFQHIQAAQTGYPFSEVIGLVGFGNWQGKYLGGIGVVRQITPLMTAEDLGGIPTDYL